ncbi:unnamed protein product [Rotaria sp. Silwood2]|nr:unnamed protein product [Rotaria sp. Silwood2]CAF4362522.1 unnamed protein product [Rotaria sp. Silwood2]
MASSLVHCELIASELNTLTTIQLDEEHQVLFALTNYFLTRIDLTKTSDNSQIICQHNRKAQGEDNENDDYYSQGESDDEMPRESDPFEDSEPSTDDDEETIADRRNWRRYGWRTYKLDNPCSILFLPEENRLVVLNEGVITFMTIDMENGRPFAKGPSMNIFCFDYEIFTQNSIQPWSIAPTATVGLFVFSLLDSTQLYSLDISKESPVIKQMIRTSVAYCPNLLFHSQSNTLFVYDSTQLFAVSLTDGTVATVDFPKLDKEHTISAITTDKMGYVYILTELTIFKCTWTSQLHPVERLEKIDVPPTCAYMVVTKAGTDFYLSDTNAGSIYRCRKVSA